MSQNDIDDVLDYLTRIKSGRGELRCVNIDQIEKLEIQIRLFRTFTKYNHLLLPKFLHIIKKKAKLIVKLLHSAFDECKSNLNLERLESQLLEFIGGNTILRHDYELKDSYLSEYMDCIGKNLYDVWMWLKKNMSDMTLTNEEILEINPFIKQLKMISKKMRFLKYLYVSEVNGHVDPEKLEGLETRIQFMADNVGQFCLYLSANINSDEDEDDTDEDKDDTHVGEDDTDEDEDDTHVDEDDTHVDEDDTDEDEDDTNEDENDTHVDEDDTHVDEDDTDEDEDNTDEDEDDTHVDEDDTDEDEDDTHVDEDDAHVDEDDAHVDEDDVNIYDTLSKPPYLLSLIVLVDLEMKKIFLGELKASKFSQSRTFKGKKLPKGFLHSLHNLLMYLRNEELENFTNNISAQKIDVAIEFLLVFLNADLSYHVSNGRKLNELMVKVGALAGDILYVVQKLLPISINKDDTSKVSLCSMQIWEKTKDLKDQMETYYKSLKFRTPSQFPTVGGLSFLDSLLRKLKEMLKSESGLDFMMKCNIGFPEKEFSSLTSIFEKEFSSLTSILEKELSSLTFVLRDVLKVQHNREEILNDLSRHTINLAYEAELSVDSVLVQYNVHWHIFCSLPAIIKEIKHICGKVTEVRLRNLSLKPFSVVESSKHLPNQHSNTVNDEEIVGFENEAEELVDYLTRGTRELDVIPIVGMGGQGKTTIARKVYNNDIIVSRFDVRAWSIISQTYNRRELLKEIFCQVTGSKSMEDKVCELADMLKKKLQGNRYLIVLDDMWDCMAWDDLWLSFPNEKNGSRILITTRLESVGKQVKLHTDPYPLPFLTPEDSSKLLQKKVFPQEVFPPELLDVNLEIAEKCKRLPLVVILVAGIIKKNKMEASWWHEVKDALFDYLDRESEQYSLSTMQLSYDYLPDFLRPCLLYMGMFPEDAKVPVSKLISLWIAEGFVQNIESERSMEEAAEGFLMDLISSNMVMVSERSYNGKVETCQVHDVVLHFCLRKSREENFMLAVKGLAIQFRPLDWKGYRVRFSFSEELSEFAYLGSKTTKPFHQRLRSLITTNDDFIEGFTFHPVSVARLLKVLDLSSRNVPNFSTATLKPLIHLKYLSVSTGEFDFHPEPHLPHLETLIVEGFTTLPAIFWKMGKLRHVDITRAEFDFEEYKHWIFEGCSKFENLRILRQLSFPSDEACEAYMLSQRCPNLQELHLYFQDNKDSPEINLELRALTQLQSLRLSFQRPLYLSKLHLPSNLKKLEIKATNIPRVFSISPGLASLEYLHLYESPGLRHGHSWWSTVISQIIVPDITFHKLKLLELVDLEISKWEASEESFPVLETLVIKRCLYLKEIPLSFADIQTLKHIELMYCRNESLEASAARIKQEAERIEGCDRINITIQARPRGNIRRF